jgi:hypothetical protein
VADGRGSCANQGLGRQGMSVQLHELKGGKDFDDIEIMAPDYDKESFWMWRAYDGENRIDFSLEQMRALRDWLNEEAL